MAGEIVAYEEDRARIRREFWRDAGRPWAGNREQPWKDPIALDRHRACLLDCITRHFPGPFPFPAAEEIGSIGRLYARLSAEIAAEALEEGRYRLPARARVLINHRRIVAANRALKRLGVAWAKDLDWPEPAVSRDGVVIEPYPEGWASQARDGLVWARNRLESEERNLLGLDDRSPALFGFDGGHEGYDPGDYQERWFDAWTTLAEPLARRKVLRVPPYLD